MAKINYKKPAGKIVASAALVALLGVAAANMTVEHVAEYEGYVENAYLDPVGIWTICFGDTKNVKPGMREDFEGCLRRLNAQVIAHAKPVLKCIPELRDQHPDVITAMVSMAYNIGTGAFCKSSVAQRANAGNWKGACQRMAEIYKTAKGRELPGLVKRRRDESNLCLRGVNAGKQKGVAHHDSHSEPFDKIFAGAFALD